jgi:hypothetical protein
MAYIVHPKEQQQDAMEVIAEINDLACDSIESGDYQTALDVLNCCLGCVKQIKKCRATMVEDRNRDRHCYYSKGISKGDGISFKDNYHNKTTRENVAMLLKGAKRRLANRNRKRSMTASNAAAAAVTVVAVVTTGNKRTGVIAAPSTSNDDVTSTTKTSQMTIDGRASRKKRRRRALDDQENSEVTVTSVHGDANADACSFSVVPGCPVSVAIDTPSPDNDNSVCKQHNPPNHHHQEQLYNEAEDRYFIYRKPLRLTKFQWSRIAECQCSHKLLEGVEQNNCQSHIDREVELGVSSNLIFNIALSHHLIASGLKGTTSKPQEQHKQAPSSSSDDTDDDDENGYDSGSDDSATTADSTSHTHTNALQTKQRLKGALRLYELGFRIHTKRAAYVTSSQTRDVWVPSSSRSASSPSPSSATTTATAVTTSQRPSSVSRPTTTVGAAFAEQHTQTHTNTTTTTTSDRDDELRATTRFALALLNNCAHIHEALGQTDKALVFQKRLLSFLLVIVDSGESIHEIIGDNPAVDGYLKNVIAGTVFDKDTAPAAVA